MRLIDFDSDGKALDWLQASIGWLSLVFTLFSALALGANRPVTWTILAFVIAALFALQILRDLAVPNRDRSFVITLSALLYLTVIVWVFIQTIGDMPTDLAHPAWARISQGLDTISGDPTQSHHGIMRLATYGMLFWIAFRSCRAPERASRFFKLIALFSSALALFGIYAFLTGFNPILDAPSSVVNASFVNRNSYATYAVFGFLVNLACYLNQSDRDVFAETIWQRLRNTLESFFAGSWIFALGSLICLTALVLTQSRAGAGAGIIAVLVFFFSYRLRGTGNGVTLGITLIAILGFVMFTSTSGLTERLLMDREEGGRFAIYPLIIDGIKERPLLGHGLGAFHDTFRAYVPETAAMGEGEWHLAHNSYLENIYELGIPAAAALYGALVLIVFWIWQGTRTRQRDRVYSCMALAAALSAGFHSVFDFSLQMPAVAALFAILLGMGAAQSISQRKKTRRRGKKLG